MKDKFDPENLTLREVVILVLPIVLIIGVLLLVGRYARDYLPFAILILAFGSYWIVMQQPEEFWESIVANQREREKKLQEIPVVGPPLNIARRVLGWCFDTIGAILGAIFLIALIYQVFKNFWAG